MNSRLARRIPASASLLAGALLLAACAGKEPRLACPDSNIVHGLDRIEFEGGGGFVLGAFDGTCTYAGDTLELDYHLDIEGEGGKTTGEPMQATYFIAVIDADGTPLAKEFFDVDMTFSRPGERKARRDRFRQVLGLAKPDAGPGMQILFGFQLPEDQALRQRRSVLP